MGQNVSCTEELSVLPYINLGSFWLVTMSKFCCVATAVCGRFSFSKCKQMWKENCRNELERAVNSANFINVLLFPLMLTLISSGFPCLRLILNSVYLSRGIR